MQFKTFEDNKIVNFEKISIKTEDINNSDVEKENLKLEILETGQENPETMWYIFVNYLILF